MAVHNDPTKLGRRTKEQLFADLREVFSLYDLEIVTDDVSGASPGVWLRNVALEDMMCIYVQPFAAHRAFQKDGRGEKKGKRTEWGPAKRRTCSTECTGGRCCEESYP